MQGGNPSSALRRIQLEHCKKLVAEELNHFIPKRLLFLTGMDRPHPFMENEFISFKLKRLQYKKWMAKRLSHRQQFDVF